MTVRPLFTLLAPAALIVLLGSTTPAQETKQDALRQKQTASANLKKADIAKTTLVESEHFIIVTTLTQPKARALAQALEKVGPIARKALRFEAKEEAWKGKLTIYYLPDNRDFKSFIRSVVGMQPGGIHYDLRADDPFIVDPVDVPARASDGEQFHQAAGIVAGAYLKAKAGSASLPEWLVGGFGRVTALRADGLNSRRYSAHKSAARSASRTGKPAELWSDAPPDNSETLANSFVEYLAYGPGAANFGKLLEGFRPDNNGNTPSVQAAFEAAGWKNLTMLDAAWKKWAGSGR
jgi:hypothetical protein